jgi:hypothetical protein
MGGARTYKASLRGTTLVVRLWVRASVVCSLGGGSLPSLAAMIARPRLQLVNYASPKYCRDAWTAEDHHPSQVGTHFPPRHLNSSGSNQDLNPGLLVDRSVFGSIV